MSLAYTYKHCANEHVRIDIKSFSTELYLSITYDIYYNYVYSEIHKYVLEYIHEHVYMKYV